MKVLLLRSFSACVVRISAVGMCSRHSLFISMFLSLYEWHFDMPKLPIMFLSINLDINIQCDNKSKSVSINESANQASKQPPIMIPLRPTEWVKSMCELQSCCLHHLLLPFYAILNARRRVCICHGACDHRRRRCRQTRFINWLCVWFGRIKIQCNLVTFVHLFCVCMHSPIYLIMTVVLNGI